jgi:hypothetical protein
MQHSPIGSHYSPQSSQYLYISSNCRIRQSSSSSPGHLTSNPLDSELKPHILRSNNTSTGPSEPLQHSHTEYTLSDTPLYRQETDNLRTQVSHSNEHQIFSNSQNLSPSRKPDIMYITPV